MVKVELWSWLIKNLATKVRKQTVNCFQLSALLLMLFSSSSQVISESRLMVNKPKSKKIATARLLECCLLIKIHEKLVNFFVYSKIPELSPKVIWSFSIFRYIFCPFLAYFWILIDMVFFLFLPNRLFLTDHEFSSILVKIFIEIEVKKEVRTNEKW